MLAGLLIGCDVVQAIKLIQTVESRWESGYKVNKITLVCGQSLRLAYQQAFAAVDVDADPIDGDKVSVTGLLQIGSSSSTA